ncbi:MAG: DUF89 family protein [Clostridiaceae bacterium]|nr:DUF89 family protein [Clostridiaceae bacterium]
MKYFAIIADNAGEIVLDKVFIKVIKNFYPDVTIDVIVRGKPIYNDATMFDAQGTGLCIRRYLLTLKML